MLFTKLALERSERILITKFNHSQHLAWACPTCPCTVGYTKPSQRGCYRSNSVGTLLYNITVLVTKLTLEMSCKV